MTKIINFFGAPCAGKSLRAAEAYVALKKLSLNAELSREFAKDKVYESNRAAIACEPLIMAQELYKIETLVMAGVEYIVCDCPIITPCFYNKNRSKLFELFSLEMFNKFDNFNVFLKIDRANYQDHGRIHTYDESLKIERKMLNFLDYHEIPYVNMGRSEVFKTGWVYSRPMQVITDEFTKIESDEHFSTYIGPDGKCRTDRKL